MNKILVAIVFSGLTLLLITLTNLIRNNPYISFSDSAKYADIARNVKNGHGYKRDFTFFSGVKNYPKFESTWVADWPPPVTPLLLAASFSVFGVSDVSVKIATLLFFILTLIFVYMLTSKIYGKIEGVLAVMAVGFSYDMLKYSLSGGTEMFFIFEIVFGFYMLSINKKWSNVLAIGVSILMYLTRPQYFIFSIGFLIFYLFRKFTFTKGLLIFISISILWATVDMLLMPSIKGYSFIYSVSGFGSYGLSSSSASDQLRGVSSSINLKFIFSRLFYTLYNFYKSISDILNPYLLLLFFIGILTLSKNNHVRLFKISVFFVTGLIFFVTALTVPFYRYLHPVIPLVYIVAVGTLVGIVSRFTGDIWKFNKHNVETIISFVFIFLFSIGQTLGIVFIDARSERKIHNTDKVPIYVVMSYKLKEITGTDDVVVTNLDTWGSWYGERKTIWFPVEPNFILKDELNIKYIYLTSYKMNDENYYMGQNWREIFLKPEDQTMLKNYKFVSEYRFDAKENYENEEGRAVLLERIK